MSDDRFDRSVRFFGTDGQRRIQDTTLTIAGVGGLGSIVVQHAALLGFGAMYQVDPGEFKTSGRNRYVTARHDDPVPGTRKVDIGRRLAHSINPAIRIESVAASIISEGGFAAIKESDIVLGCLDTDGARLLLLQVCAVLRKPYIDMATQILPEDTPIRYGGRVCSSFFGCGCLACLDVIDRQEASRDLAGDAERANREALYGVAVEHLADSGPSVAPLNGVVASLGMMELMAFITGLREPQPHLNFDGRTGKVGLRVERVTDQCYFCDGLFTGKLHGDIAELPAIAMTQHR
jgi:molybdopterin/thiamine biosynthesis adenylyltransferase